jgi:hypothetical protein
MKTIQVNLYQFSELSEDAKEKAILKLYDINVDFDWWSYLYEDAKQIGLKIKEFDLDRNRYCKGEFINFPTETAEKILLEHGKDCETYKTAKEFLNDLNELTSKFENIEDCPEDDFEDLENEFLYSLCEDYSILLQKECEYLQSSEAIIETIEANEYYFDENGNLA